MKTLESLVDGFKGECTPVWLDKNLVSRRLLSRTTGFFKLVKIGWFGIKYKYGNEFHGYIDSDFKVRTTEGIYNRSHFL